MVEQDLIYLLSCAVKQEAPDPKRVAAMDLDALFALASRHMLAATAAPALKAAGVQDRRFAKALEHAILKNSTMDMEMETLFAELDKGGIWHMPLKGIVLQHLYPLYGMRQMSDHDFLIDATRMTDVRTIMEAQGFQVKSHDATHHDVYCKEPVSNFQMHRRLFDQIEGKKLFSYYEDVQSRLRSDGYEKHFSPEDFYLYLIAHEYRHYRCAGTGLRSLLDTYVYLQKEKLDMAYVTAEAEKLGIAEFEAANRSLALHLFSGEALTAAEREMLDYFLDSGVYGSLTHKAKNKMARHGYGKIRYALHRFLVPVRKKNPFYAAYAGVYPQFYRHRILLPLLPFYRTFRAIKSGSLKAEAEAIKRAKQ